MAEAKKKTAKTAATKKAVAKKTAATKVKKTVTPKKKTVKATTVVPKSKSAMLVRRFEGVVVKKSGDKTVRVRISRVIMDAKYKKRMKTYTDYLVHDERNQFKVGDAVTIESSRPHSANKRFVVVYTK